jgi:tRNA-dihydrouridine synthase B
MPFRWKDQKKPLLCLAPMEGYTDSAYRQIIKEIEPQTICFTEFTSADGLKFGNKNSFKRIEFKPEIESPLIAQIFGSDPNVIAESAKILEDMGVAAIDINMGCPSGKIISTCRGSALFEEPELAFKIVKAAQQAVDLDVSVKMRIGFKKYDLPTLLEFTKNLEESGAKHIAIHGRTTKEKYTGKSNWEPIYEVKKQAGIPITGNGDILTVEDVQQKLKGLDGVMIGRATYGNPWIMKEVQAYFDGIEFKGPQTLEEKLPTIMRQCKLASEFKGEKRGVIEMRKHLSNYIHGFKNASKFRFRLVRVNTVKDIEEIFEEILNYTE